MPDYDETQCPACGVPYTEHPGLTLTCERLRKAKEDIERLREEINRLKEAAEYYE